MRIIPKKSNMRFTVWKSYTIFDVILAFLVFSVAILIAATNIRPLIKWTLMAFYCFFAILSFLPVYDEKAYLVASHMVRYLFSTKGFTENTKKKSKHIDNFIPQSKLRDDGIIEYGEYYGGVISVDSIEFRLLNDWSQNNKISAFARVINSLTSEQSAQIVKIDRPINFDDISQRIFQKVSSAAADAEIDIAKVAILKSRLNQIDQVNNIEKQYRPFYYFVIYDTDLQNLQNTLSLAEQTFSQMEIDASRLNAKELALFLKYCYTRNFDERDIDSIDPSKYLEFIRPKNARFSAWNGAVIDDVNAMSFAISLGYYAVG